MKFITTQWKYFLHSIPQRRSAWHIGRLPLEAWYLVRNVHRHRAALKAPAPAYPGTERCGIVLLSHNRPQNIDWIVRSALKNAFVGSLVVSNSNRGIQIADWVRVEDPRLTLVDERESTQPGHRFAIARQMDADWFLAVDDDIFLTPEQWMLFFSRLVEQPAVPHGLTGNLYKENGIDRQELPFAHVTEVECEVDVLIGAYAFSRDHLDSLFSISKGLGFPNISLVRNGEDIMLSFAGSGRPVIHDLGRIFCCATSSVEGVALWKTHGNFWRERAELFERVRELAGYEVPITKASII